MPPQPFDDLRVLVSGVVVEDDVDDLAGRHLCLDLIEKADEFLMAMPLHALADDRAVQHVEGGEQRSCAVTLVVMRHRSAAPGFKGKPG